MSYQVISARGDDVYAFVDDEADAKRIDNAMRILLTSDTYNTRENPIDTDILAFIEQNNLKNMSHVVEILTKVNIAITGQDTNFKLSNRIVPTLKYFFGDYGRGEYLDPNFFTTLAAFSRKEISAVINGFRSLASVLPSGLIPSPSHNATPNLQTLYIFSKLCTSSQYGFKSIFSGLAEDIEDSLSSEWSKNDDGVYVASDELNKFFKQYNHYTKYQSLPITIEVLNASVEKMLNFGFDLPVFIRKSSEKDETMVATYIHAVELHLKQYEDDGSYDTTHLHSLRSKLEKISRDMKPSMGLYKEVCNAAMFQSVKLRGAIIRPNMFDGNSYKHVMSNVAYELGYVLPKQLQLARWDMSYAGSYTDLVFYTTSFMSYLLASSGELFDSLKQPNVGISKCIQRFLDNANKGQLKADEIYSIFCSEDPQWIQRDFFKKGFLLYSRYIDLRARPKADTYTDQYISRRLYEIYRDHLDLLNEIYNALTFDDSLTKTFSDVEAALVCMLKPYLPSAQTSIPELHTTVNQVLDDFVKKHEMLEDLSAHKSLMESMKDLYQRYPEKLKWDNISIAQQKLYSEILAVAEIYLNQPPTKFTESFESLIGNILELVQIFEVSASDSSVSLDEFTNNVRYLPKYLRNATEVYQYLFSWKIDRDPQSGKKYKNVANKKFYSVQSNYTLVKLGKTNPLNLIIGLKDVSNCCMIFNSAGFGCSEDAFYGRNDSTIYLLYNNATNTFWGSSWAFGSNDSGVFKAGNLSESVYHGPMYAIDQFELSYTGMTMNERDQYKALNSFVEGVINLELSRLTEKNNTTVLYINTDTAGGLKSSYSALESATHLAWQGSNVFGAGDDVEAGYTRVVPQNEKYTYQDAQSDKPCIYVSEMKSHWMQGNLIVEDSTIAVCEVCGEVDLPINMHQDLGGHDYVCTNCSSGCDVCDDFFLDSDLEDISDYASGRYSSHAKACASCRVECDSCGEYFPEDEPFDDKDRCSNCTDEDEDEDEDEDY
jgi:hypothetical protein